MQAHSSSVMPRGMDGGECPRRACGNGSEALMQHLQDLRCLGSWGCTSVQHLHMHLIPQNTHAARSAKHCLHVIQEIGPPFAWEEQPHSQHIEYEEPAL